MAEIKIHTPQGPVVFHGERGTMLDDIILSAGVLFDRPCGGRGKCGKCRVKVSGELSALSEVEREKLSPADIEEGVRLACQARVLGDAEVWFESEVAFSDKTFSLGYDLSRVSGDLGLAVDLGTTTVAAFVTGLSDGKVYAGNATLNLQKNYGAEVMSRLLEGDKDPDRLEELAWQSVREAVAGLQLEEDVLSRIKRAVAVGNSAMHHLALKLPVKNLYQSPFQPHTLEPGDVQPVVLSSIAPNIHSVKFAPLIGGFVGADALACFMFFSLGRETENSALAVDLGTNGEVLLAANGKLLAASTAAGPAFEAVNISCGMRAEAGAVTSVRCSDTDGVELDTISKTTPRGICGSGLISAVKAMEDIGVIDVSGRIADKSPLMNVKIETVDGIKRVVLAGGVYVSQSDVRELQKAKGAIRAAADILLEHAGLDPAELSRVILTGGFGGRLDPQEVLALGVLPQVPVARVLSIPNGAGMGAAMMLDEQTFEEARDLAGRIEHVELNLDPAFMEKYVSSMMLGEDQGEA